MKKYNSKTIDEVRFFIEETFSKNIGVKFYLDSNKYENNRTNLCISDESGYRYCLSYGSIKNTYDKNSIPLIVYSGNIYSIENIKRYIEINNLDCSIVSNKFINVQDKLDFKCHCGNIFSTTWNEFVSHNKHQCNACGRKIAFKKQKVIHKKKRIECMKIEKEKPSKINKMDLKRKTQYEKIKSTVEEKGITILTNQNEYINTNQQIHYKCHCGNDFYSMANGYKHTQNCPECAHKIVGDKKRLKENEILCGLEKIGKENRTIYTWLSGNHFDKNSNICISDSDGYLYEISAHYLFAKDRNCNFMKFTVHNPYTLNNIKLWMLTNAKGYELLSTEYVNTNDKLLFKCPEGHIFETSWTKFRGGRRCVECTLSQGARMVYYRLKELNYNFDVEYRFKDCKYKNTLPFDFVVFNEDNSILCAIEFDGEFHYKPNTFSSATDKNLRTFKYTKIRDEVKNEYCKSNNIPLLRIPYWERDNGNVEKIVDDFLNSLLSNQQSA